jgi:tRNA threonylcarbamoyladenosine biosynthesis protein TsaB
MQLAIESASDNIGIALAVGGVVGMMATWETQQRHSVELLPNIERLLAESGRTKSDIDAVLVDLGPGGYAALRVGVSVAKAIAHGLGVAIAGVGRLELDARAVGADAGERRIVAVHRAGRGESAWATYQHPAATWHELSAPRIAKSPELYAALRSGDVVTGDIDDALTEAVRAAGAAIATPNVHRVVVLAAAGNERLEAGRADDPAALVPLYLRAPAIGPQANAT